MEINIRSLPRTLLLLAGLISVSSAEHDNITKTISAARWDFHEFSIHITLMLFLLIVIIIKMAYHRIRFIHSYLPESLLLIIVGVLFGVIVRFGSQPGDTTTRQLRLNPSLFFIYLLPPIVLDAAYSLYNRTFSEHLGVVLIFAVLGTILNFLIIGFAMFGLYKVGAFGPTDMQIDLKGMLLFSSLIVAIDPVAVLAIFQDIGVELSLYYIVFGESLLNDAITVVLYVIMSAFAGKDEVSGHEIGVGIASFFTVSLGGLLIGVVVGVISCLITRLKSRLNAFTLLLLAYFSYIMGDVVGWSGIISMIGCGLVQAAYAFDNLDADSVILVREFTKLVAEVSESVIFFFLGLEVLSVNLKWDTGFVLWGMLVCILARAVVVFALSFIVNVFGMGSSRLSVRNQIILIYGGLRGAVAFSLAVLIAPTKPDVIGKYNRECIITSTLFNILFTVGIMGTTMKPLVKYLHISMQSKKVLSLFNTLNESVIDETLAGIEVILGTSGRNVVREFFIRIDDKYLRKLLQRQPETRDQTVMRMYEKVVMKLHDATIHPERIDEILADLPDTFRSRSPDDTVLTDDHKSMAQVEGEGENLLQLLSTTSTKNAQLSGGRQLPFSGALHLAIRNRATAHRRMSHMSDVGYEESDMDSQQEEKMGVFRSHSYANP